MKEFNADLFVLVGYSKIIRQNIINIPKKICINLHGGKLPLYRGSSPMNWAIINGEKTITISIIQVDTGDILIEKTFPIGPNDTIREVHQIANLRFPQMILEVLDQIEMGTIKSIKQDHNYTSYYPLRFPSDGFVVWDLLTAEQVHNRIRALTRPYPCAFAFYDKRKVILISSELYQLDFHGEPGRIYKKNNKGLLVCASDKCLWIKEAYFEDNNSNLLDAVEVYQSFATLRDLLINNNFLSAF